MRYVVIPRRPDGTEGWEAGRLAALVTRDSMIGVAESRAPA
jgi:nitrile hydratase